MPNRLAKGVLVLAMGLGLVFAGVHAVAQTITGSIRGSVSDPSGAAVPKASVTATNTATGVKTSTTSDAGGLYNFQFLPIGSYTIDASAAGFSTARVGPLNLEIDQIAQINIKLAVGSVSTTVSVSADTAAIL